jgi:hypothetical protein
MPRRAVEVDGQAVLGVDYPLPAHPVHHPGRDKTAPHILTQPRLRWASEVAGRSRRGGPIASAPIERAAPPALPAGGRIARACGVQHARSPRPARLRGREAERAQRRRGVPAPRPGGLRPWPALAVAPRGRPTDPRAGAAGAHGSSWKDSTKVPLRPRTSPSTVCTSTVSTAGAPPAAAVGGRATCSAARARASAHLWGMTNRLRATSASDR